MTYDSTVDTLKHIKRVNELMVKLSTLLLQRAVVHDASKLQEPEKSYFDKATQKLNGLTYGSEEYRAALRELKPALDHHYQHNSHHPEHYAEGINGFDLLDLVEMLVDWKAASERHADGDIIRSIIINQERFGYDDILKRILINTVVKYFMD